MKRAVLCVMLLSFTAFAADPVLDAPVLKAGDPAPFEGVLLSSPLAVEVAQEKKVCQIELGECRKIVVTRSENTVSVPWVVGGGLIVAAVFTAIGFGIAKATEKKP